MNIFDKLIEEFRSFLQKRSGELRAKDFSGIMMAVQSQLEPLWVNDVYRDASGDWYVTVVDFGKLYRSVLDFDESGNPVVGELEEVEVQHVPVSRSVQIQRQADGTFRWFEIASTSVLNKDGEIDSTKLFDSFVSYIERTGNYPYRTFHHQGEAFYMGDYDFIARDGFVLLASGVYADNELAKLDIKARTRRPGFWGQSINFYPVGDPELWEVTPGVEIPVYRAGILEEISSLPADSAAAHYTQRAEIRQEVTRSMLKGKELEAFTELFDGDREAAVKWLEENVDRTNAEITEQRQITRASEDTESTEAESEAVDETSESEEAPDTSTTEETTSEEPADGDPPVAEGEPEIHEIVADDDVIEAITSQLLETEVIQSLRQMVNGLVEQIEELTETVNGLQAASQARTKKIEERFQLLEREEEEKQAEWRQDIPRRERRTKVTFRPRNAKSNGVDSEPEQSLEEIANSTIDMLED